MCVQWWWLESDGMNLNSSRSPAHIQGIFFFISSLDPCWLSPKGLVTFWRQMFVPVQHILASRHTVLLAAALLQLIVSVFVLNRLTGSTEAKVNRADGVRTLISIWQCNLSMSAAVKGVGWWKTTNRGTLTPGAPPLPSFNVLNEAPDRRLIADWPSLHADVWSYTARYKPDHFLWHP